MDYNTTREKIIIPEYGRNVHKMIEYAMTIEDRAMRSAAARSIIIAMAQLTNAAKEGGDIRRKLWDHLYIMSDYKLDVDSPFPMPQPASEMPAPQKPAYPHNHIRFRQYGKSVELMIEKTIEYEDGPEKETLTRYIANHLKKMYLNWNRESVQDDLIGQHLSTLSNGKLTLAEDVRLESTAEIITRNKKKKTTGSQKQSSNQKNYIKFNNKKNQRRPIG
jgi:hypothetical protein